MPQLSHVAALAAVLAGLSPSPSPAQPSAVQNPIVAEALKAGPPGSPAYMVAMRRAVEEASRRQLSGGDPARTKSVGDPSAPIVSEPLRIDADERYQQALAEAAASPTRNLSLPTGQLGVKSIGGRKIPDHRVFPDVALAMEPPDQGFCSGVLIDRRTVLTAAHCFCEGAIKAVKFGTYPRDPRFQGFFNVEKQVVHPKVRCTAPGVSADDFIKSLYGNDIGILRLAWPVPETWVPRPAGLPRPDLLQLQFRNGNKSLQVVGFGLTDLNSTNEFEKSMVSVPVLSPDCSGPATARRAADADHYGCEKGKEILAVDVRSRATPAGPCPGDSGGGAYVTVKDSAGRDVPTLVGLVSRGILNAQAKCGDGSIYTLLHAEHQAWIRQTMAAWDRP